MPGTCCDNDKAAGTGVKMKGVATVREHTGEVYEAEIHWFEAHGVGRREWKIKH